MSKHVDSTVRRMIRAIMNMLCAEGKRRWSCHTRTFYCTGNSVGASFGHLFSCPRSWVLRALDRNIVSPPLVDWSHFFVGQLAHVHGQWSSASSQRP